MGLLDETWSFPFGHGAFLAEPIGGSGGYNLSGPAPSHLVGGNPSHQHSDTAHRNRHEDCNQHDHGEPSHGLKVTKRGRVMLGRQGNGLGAQGDSRALRPRGSLSSCMFESLSDRFDAIFTRLRGRGRLSEADVDVALREIRQALLEADVNFRVARRMVGRIREKAVGALLSEVLNPSQQIIKLVHEELVSVLGGEALKLSYASKPPTVILLAGLQGAGKTTAAGKLARWFKSNGRNPLLVGADLQRPAAVEQLRILGHQVGVGVFSTGAPNGEAIADPVECARLGLEEARRTGKDVLIVDTAGRLSIDTELMDQVRDISSATSPDYTFLVIDAMIGQESVSTAEAFHETLALDGVILTKLDGDARGGAALSVKEVVGKPIVFASTGEKLSDFDLFHPDRMAQRILGMGDVMSLIEKAESVYEKEEAEKAAQSLLAGRFTLEDFLQQMQQVKKMGPLKGLMGMLPGVPKEIRNVDIDDHQINRVEGIIRSMTAKERRNPDLIDGSRRLRIANGSGVSPSEVNMLLKQFEQMQKMMKGIPALAGAVGGMSSPRKGGKKQKRGGRTTPKGSRR